MSLINLLEPKFGRHAIPGLIPAIAILQLIVFFIALANPGYIGLLNLDFTQILQGQVWRLLSWLILPVYNSIIWAIIGTMVTIMIARALEEAWGAFRLNIFYLVSTGAVVAVSLIFHLIGYGIVVSNLSFVFPLDLNSAVFLSFAVLFPNFEFRLYFFIPVKVKWLAILSAAFIVFRVIDTSFLIYFTTAAHLPFLLWAVPIAVRSYRQRANVAARRSRFQRDSYDPSTSFHTCHACSKTEHDDPHLEFRVSAD
ncbi:MAG: hypothetical protein P8J87_02580, partial [Verrucomicrobiales bacterium]|nr:hypothetical protein [Verrucomicrobiales bacterium]